MKASDLPHDAVADTVMARPAELAAAQAWALQAFTGRQPAADAQVRLQLRRQDFSALHFNQSCMDTPLRIGRRSFARGLGTHANSEIVVTCPPGARRFAAWVGVDNNYSTGGRQGSVQFIVEAAGRELSRTPTLTGSDQPVQLEVDLPAGTAELTLKVWTTDDGPGWDQADWAEARLLMADGSVHWLDEAGFTPLLPPQPPFSFTYAGRPSAELLAAWPRTVETKDTPAAVEHTVTWADPDTGLAVTAVATAWKRYPAVDWVLYFENKGSADTPLIEQVQALDLQLATPADRQVVLHELHGDSCGERSFQPFDTAIKAGETVRRAPRGGRPCSESAFPWWNLEFEGQGLITAIGWTGQWASNLARADSGATRVQAGMELTHLKLHPGERIRTPRVLVLPWHDSAVAAHNRWRRLLLHHYVPQQDGHPVALPFVSQCFDRYWRTAPEWPTEQGQIEGVQFAAKVGCDTHWLDAAWFPLRFPLGVGNWYATPEDFPRGLGPVGEECHRLGLKFVLWFEPERVCEGTQIAREHPEFVFGGEKGGLFKLNDPAARKWLTDLLSQRITEYKIDIYRNDFNMDPLGYWQDNDEPDRQGMTEIRYVEGLYQMWDELRARHPGLLIDNCSSGGRRIDLEMCMRSVPFWRSDTSCSPGHPHWNQMQSQALSPYVPLHMACGWDPDAYTFRSSATAGAISQWDYRAADFPLALAQATMAEAKANAKYWYGDFYPLNVCGTDQEHWAAFQFHRPDLGAGLVLAFRREGCRYPVISLELQGLDPAATYRLELIDDRHHTTTKRLTGRDLAAGLEVRLPQPGSSLAIRYQAAAQRACTVGEEPRL